MSEKLGGTTMHCPLCDEVAVCAALPFDRGPQLGQTKNGGVWHFARHRQCQSCFGHFETVEVPTRTLDAYELRLWQIRNDLADRYERALGADETILSWVTDLKLRARAIERSLEDLHGLGKQIETAVEKHRFLKTGRE